MDIRDLECFLALAETRSFTKAADALNMAQPPLSRRIAGLEAALGVRLIHRTRPLDLTAAGRYLAQEARRMLARLADVEATTRRIGKGRERYFGIGFVGSTLYGVLPQAIRHITTSHPGLEVGLHELSTLEQRQALLDRRIDIGFGRLDLGENPGVARATIANEALVLVCSLDHALGQRDGIGLEEIGAHPFLLYPARPRPSFADQVLDIFEGAGLTLNVAFEANDLQGALGLISAGLGVTLAPQSVAATSRADVAFVPVTSPLARSPIIVSWRAGETSPLVQAMLEVVGAA